MKVKIEYQYFDGCPNHQKLWNNLQDAIKEFSEQVEVKYVNIEDEEMAKKYKFRGSPTILINDVDLEDMPVPENPSLACRFYPMGIPTAEKIRQRINEFLAKV